MAMIDERHVEWRVIARLGELLRTPPTVEHDVTLTYSLFTSILCWVCERIRDPHHEIGRSLWGDLRDERAFDQPWLINDIPLECRIEGAEPVEALPVSVFLVGLRNAVAHGDDRKVAPLHVVVEGRADRRLIGFRLIANFGDRDRPEWGHWLLDLTLLDMRRIGLALADRFCDQMSADARADAVSHVLMA